MNKNFLNLKIEITPVPEFIFKKRNNILKTIHLSYNIKCLRHEKN